MCTANREDGAGNFGFAVCITESGKSPASIALSNKQWGDLLVSGVVQATPDKLQSSYSVMKYHKEGPACGRIPYDPASSEADCEYPL